MKFVGCWSRSSVLAIASEDRICHTQRDRRRTWVPVCLHWFDRSNLLPSRMRAISGIVTNFIAVVTFPAERPEWKSSFAFASFASFSSLAFALVSTFVPVVCALLPCLAFTFDHSQECILHRWDHREFIAIRDCLLAFWSLDPLHPVVN